VLGVEAYSLLPNDPYDRGNLSSKGRAILWPHAFSNESCVERCEEAWFARSQGGGTLKQVLQIVITVTVETEPEPSSWVVPAAH